MNLPRLILRTLLGRRLPRTSGTLTVAGIAQPVTIRRDAFGIPYIEARTSEDAFYGLGFCQGQDRGFQLEMLLRLVRGTLSELVGKPGLPMDRLSRRIGFRRIAQQQMDVLEPSLAPKLAAFAQGINDGVRLGCPRPAHELALLRAKPTPLETADILAMSAHVAFSLSTWATKLSRLFLLRQEGPEAVKALDGAHAAWLPVTCPVAAPAGPALDRLGQDLARLAGTLGVGGASNNWALASSRTATGRPLVANDPHLGASIPPPWYLAQVRTPQWAVTGACFVGLPAFAAGHNDTAAWGVTAGLADNVDLYLEELGKDPRTVRDGDHFVPCEIRRETIQVKGQVPVVEEIVVTPRGPIISDLLDDELGAISMCAAWMKPRSIRGMLEAQLARSFEEFRSALAGWPGVSLNMVYADTSDRIGWQLVGDVPQRNGAWGTVPLPGWDPAFRWDPDPIPFRQLPHLSDPEQGYVVTANNQPTVDGKGPYLGMDWADGYRYARIAEVLSSRHDWDLAATQALQMDQTSIPWREIRAAVLSVRPQTPEGEQALDLLRSWDGVVAGDSPGAAIFEFFVTELLGAMVKARFPHLADRAMSGRRFHPMIGGSIFGTRSINHLVQLLRERPEGWFQRPWETEIADALAHTVHELRAEFGPALDGWRWGHVRPLTLRHALGARRPLNRIFNCGPFPWGGDSQTVSAAAKPIANPKGNPLSIANLRMVVDVGNWEDNRFVLAGGQSGNPVSPHYADQLPLWVRGEGIAVAWSEEAIARVQKSALQLIPTGDSEADLAGNSGLGP